MMTGEEREVLDAHIQREESAIESLIEMKREYERIIAGYTFRVDEANNEIQARRAVLEKLRALH